MHCNRCNKDTKKVSGMSWFTKEILCMPCKEEEGLVRDKLPADGHDFEGCGYIPRVAW